MTFDRFKNVNVIQMCWSIAARILPGKLLGMDIASHLQTKNEQENSGLDGLEQQCNVGLEHASKHFRGKWG